MRICVLHEDIRYTVENREVYKIATSILDEVLNLMPKVSCKIYSATPQVCEVSVKVGEYYNNLLKKKSYKYAMNIKVSMKNKHAMIIGTNIRFPFGPNLAREVANIVAKYLTIAGI